MSSQTISETIKKKSRDNSNRKKKIPSATFKRKLQKAHQLCILNFIKFPYGMELIFYESFFFNNNKISSAMDLKSDNLSTSRLVLIENFIFDNL